MALALTLLIISIVFDVLVGLMAAVLLVQELRKRPWRASAPQGPGGQRTAPVVPVVPVVPSRGTASTPPSRRAA